PGCASRSGQRAGTSSSTMAARPPRRLAAAAAEQRVTLIEIALAIPAGSGLAATHKQLLAAAVACPDLYGGRADFRANRLEWIRVVARLASWTQRDPDPRATSRPTRDRVCDTAGFSTRTFKRCRAWWEDAGCVAVVRQGRTEAARRGARRQGMP